MGFKLVWNFSVHSFDHLAISGVERNPKLSGHNIVGCLPVCLSVVILPEYLTLLDCSINFWPPHSYLQFSIVLLETAGSISFK